ncbi:PIN domain-containing protein [Limnohabitans sp.]|uniref:PIN domain-containing protein n=1 Tax=Limnohabitans sp. TaxID=1907725 RepID=UPI00286EE117|nr:PIN domain-containing protein [Limnohabitans sp.]
MSQVFLDSNVVLYLLSADACKADKAEALLSQQPYISVQVLNEVTSVCRRKFSMPWPEVQDLLLALKANCKVLPLTVDTHALAVSIAQQHQLSFYDAHIVATAIQSSASTLLSEDMHEGLGVGPIKIQNPFAVH